VSGLVQKLRQVVQLTGERLQIAVKGVLTDIRCAAADLFPVVAR